MTEVNNTLLIASVVEEHWEDELKKGKTGQPNTEIQMAMLHELFQKLPLEEREEWKAKAKDTADHNWAKYHNLLKAPSSKDPV